MVSFGYFNIYFYFVSLGNVNNDLTFEYGEGTSTYGGCGVTFLGEFWYFGGESYRRQVN